MARVVPVWIGFVAVHLWLITLNLTAPNGPLGDVQWVYPGWLQAGLGGSWVGIDRPFVYPILALVPIAIPQLAGGAFYPISWLVMVSILDAVALRMILGDTAGPGSARRIGAAVLWLVFQTLLGPIALGRIDSVTVPIAIAAVTVVARHPRAAAALLTVAAWIKVWPAVLVAALVVTDARRRAIAVTAAGVSALVIAVALILGSGGNVLSFVGQQAGRGLQLESPGATPFLLAALAGGAYTAYFDDVIITWQVRGDGVAAVASALTPLLVLAVLALLAIAVVGVRRRVPAERMTPWLVIAVVTALLVFNKVGSPQFVAWLAVPLVWGALALGMTPRRGIALPIALGLAIAALTQAVYPMLYDRVVSLQPLGIGLLAARNVTEVALLAVAVAGLVRAVRSSAARATGAAPRIRSEEGTRS